MIPTNWQELVGKTIKSVTDESFGHGETRIEFTDGSVANI